MEVGGEFLKMKRAGVRITGSGKFDLNMYH